MLSGMPARVVCDPKRVMRSTMKRLVFVFGAVVGVIVLGTVLIYGMGSKVIAANAEVIRCRDVMSGLEDVVEAIRDAEAGQSGYFLTGDQGYLQTYQAAVGRMRESLDWMDRCVSAGEISPESAAAAARLTRAKLDALVNTINLRTQKGLDAAIAEVRAQDSGRLNGDLRNAFTQMLAKETVDLNAGRKHRESMIELCSVLVAGMGLLNILFVVWAFKRTRETMASVERQKQLLGVTLASIGDGVIVTDARGRVTFINGEAARLTGWTLSEAMGQPLPLVFNIVNETGRQTVESLVDKVLRLGTVIGLANHTILIAKDGRETPIDDSGAPIRQADGAVYGVVLVFRDFSKQKQAELALRAGEKRYRDLVELSPDAIYVDRDGRIVLVNRAAVELFGAASESDLLGKSPLDLFHPDYHVLIRERIRLLNAGQRAPRKDEKIIRIDGRIRDVEVAAAPFVDDQGPAIQVILRDMTDRKQAQELLSQRQAMLDAVSEGSEDAIFLKDREGRYLLANPATLRAIGKPADQVIGHRDDALYNDPATGAAVVATDQRIMEAGRAETIEEPIQTSDGRRTFLTIKSPWRDGEGRVIGLIGVARDITSRKEAVEQLQAASVAKDQFLAILSHELRTPLTPVLAVVSVLREDARLDADVRDAMAMIARNVELEAKLIDDLLDVTRIAKGKIELDRKPNDLADIVRRAVEVCMPDLIARNIHFGLDLGSDGPYVVQADASRLQQVFWNLLKNSVKFTPPGGRVEIRGRREQDGNVVVDVTDNGEGIEPAVLPRLFNAFEQGGRQTTRQFGGLGLGLAISRTLVELHGGELTAQSPGRGKGATFTVRLPLAESQLLPEAGKSIAADAPSQPPASKGHLKILLAEDHVDTAHVLSRLLSSRGHEVLVAQSVAAALQLAGEHPGSFDLLLSDLGLPDGSGMDLMRALRAGGQTLPGIALSGFAQERDVRESLDAGFATHLTKPVNFIYLLDAIAAATRQTGANDPGNG